MALRKGEYVSYITSAAVTKHLQAAAKAAHGIKAAKALARFSTHSIRVGAYVLMDAADEKSHHIKKRLLWKSDTFMDYLCNVTRLAINHNDVIAKVIAASMVS